MKILTGTWHRENSFGAIESRLEQTRTTDGLRNALLLVSVGILISLSHAVLRLPLQLPGHHGIVEMAALLAMRQTLPQRWAATLTAGAAGCVTLLPGVGFGAEAAPLYLLSGLVIDLGYGWMQRWQASLAFLCVLTALANGAKPLARWLIAALENIDFGSLSHGLAYPLFSHLLFGFIGGLVSVVAFRGWQRQARPRRV